MINQQPFNFTLSASFMLSPAVLAFYFQRRAILPRLSRSRETECDSTCRGKSEKRGMQIFLEIEPRLTRNTTNTPCVLFGRT